MNKAVYIAVALAFGGILIGVWIGARGDLSRTNEQRSQTEAAQSAASQEVGMSAGTTEKGEERGAQDKDAPTVPMLNMSGQGLVSVPMPIFDHTELVSVDLSHNELTGALPAEVRHLQNLEVLNLSHNAFTGVPAEIGQLTKLRHLDLSYNQLTGLPHELGNLQSLEVLDLRGNGYSEADLEVIQTSLPGTTRVLVD